MNSPRNGAHRLGLLVLVALFSLLCLWLEPAASAQPPGGGLSQRGTEKGLRLHRKAADGKLPVLAPGLDELLRDGDVVYVRESLF